MKKSLLLSIVMTLVLVVAMSTATFAWYKANGTVTADSATITAGTASSNLVISLDGIAYDTEVDLDDATLNPMMPTAEVASVSGFETWTISSDDSLRNAGTATPYSDQIFIMNDDTNYTGTKTVSVTGAVDGELSAALKWVVLNGSTVVATSGYNVVSDAGENDTPNKVTEKNGASATFVLNQNSPVTLTIVAWLEGTAVTNASQYKTASVSFTFNEVV